MEIQKVFIKTAYCLVGISVLVLIVLTILQHQQIKKLSENVVTENVSQDESAGDAISGPGETPHKSTTQKMTPASKEIDELEYQLDAAEEELDMVYEQLADEEAKKAEQRKLQKEFQKKYLGSPAYKNSLKRSLNTQYADLFEKLNLSPETLDKFKDLMVEERMAQRDIYLDYDNTANLSKEERDELQQRYMELNKEYEAKKSDFLDENNYEIYQAYTETRSERSNINNFMTTLNSDEKLTETQKEELIESMHEARKNVVFERTDNESESSSNMYDEKNMTRMLTNYDRRIEAYLNAGNGILSASQLEKFEEYLKGQRDQYKMSMEISALRYGSSTTQSSDDKSE